MVSRQLEERELEEERGREEERARAEERAREAEELAAGSEGRETYGQRRDRLLAITRKHPRHNVRSTPRTDVMVEVGRRGPAFAGTWDITDAMADILNDGVRNRAETLRMPTLAM